MSDCSSDSESCPSFLTESESEHESNYGEEKEQKEVDYTATAKEIICENVNITTENALKLNSGYHNLLKVLKNKLEILLTRCQDRQVEIAKQIEEYKNNKKPVVGKSRWSGYICGQPYFKDEDLYPGPHNDDYLHRKNVQKEFFPLDLFESPDSNWTVRDKVNILKGVKVQIVEFIERENRLKIKKLGNGLEAERLRLEIQSLRKKDVNCLWDKVKRFSSEYPGQRFEIDWLRISNVSIGGRHSAAACIGLWNNYMLPGLVRDAWKTEEESILLDAVGRNGNQDWTEIAAEVPGRSPYQCFVHYQTTFSDLAQIKRERWTPEEDARLIKVVSEHSIGKNIVWNKVVENMPLRNKIQCYNRYMFTLMRPTKNTKFTPEEDCIILAYVQQCGDDFRFVPPNLLPGRSNRQIWARYNHTLKYVNKHAGWSIEEDMRLMNYIKENLTDEGPRKISWAACSKALGNHSRLSCRTRYYTIEKFLEKNPDATLDDVPRKGKRLSSKVTDENWRETFINIRNEPQHAQPTEVTDEPSTSGLVQIKEKPKRKPRVRANKPKPVFSDTLKCETKKHMYEKFKYSFHYRFGDQLRAVENIKVFCLTKAIFQLLNCSTDLERVSIYMDSFTPNAQLLLRNSLSIRFNPALKNFMQSTLFCFLFPPNYNTMLGMRGVILNATYPSEAKDTDKEENVNLWPTDQTGYQHALDTFRQRFRMIFYWTMLLAQQNPNEATFVDSDDKPKQEEVSQDALEQEQIALEQLTKLCQSQRLSRVVHSNTPVSTTPDEPEPTSSRKVQIISVKRITNGTLSEPIQSESSSTSQLQFGQTTTTAAPCLPPVTSVPAIVPHQPPQPYQLPYSIQPDQVHMFAPPSAPPIYGYPFPAQPNTLPPPPPMPFVTHITIINPEDLPPVRVTTDATQQPAAIVTPFIEPEKGVGSRSNNAIPIAAKGPTVAEINEIASEWYRNEEEEEHDDAGDSSAEDELLQQPVGEIARQEVEPVSAEGFNRTLYHTNSTSETIHSAEIDGIATNQPNLQPGLAEVRPEDKDNVKIEAEATSQVEQGTIAPQKAVENYPPQYLVSSSISSGEYADTCTDAMDTSRDHAGPSSEMEPSCGSADETCNLDTTLEPVDSLSSTQIRTITNVGDFVIEELQDTADSDESFKEDEIPESEPCVESSADLESSQQEHNSWLSLDEPDWNAELCEAPRRTYSRSTSGAPKHSTIQKRLLECLSHAWRWVHVDESNPEDVELHRTLWEECDPDRMQFQTTGFCEEPIKTEPITPAIDEIIVIDDDEVEIKEEPIDIVEPEPEKVDEACIQQIIETASNILQLSKALNIRASDGDEEPTTQQQIPEEPPQIPEQPPQIPVSCEEPYSDAPSDSLIVQTPSRVFDEQSNCYYYVDEVQDIPLLMGVAAQQSSNPHPVEYWSLRQEDSRFVYGDDRDSVQFASPRRIPTPAQDPQTPSSSRTVASPQQYSRPVKANVGHKTQYRGFSKSNRIEATINNHMSPQIRRAKRPPKDKAPPNAKQQHRIQSQALNLLDALLRQPKLPPIRQRPPSPSTSVVSVSSCNSERPQKRPSSSQRLSTEQSPIKQIKLELEESTSEELLDTQFDAVDVISMLAKEEAVIQEDGVNEEENEYLAQLGATPGKSPTYVEENLRQLRYRVQNT